MGPAGTEGANLLPFVPADGSGVRRLFGLDDRFVVAVGGSLSGQHHDVDTLLFALAALSKDMPVTLLVVGAGAARSHVELNAALLGVDVRFAGPISDEKLPSYLAAADAGVVGASQDPILEDDSSSKALGFLACGLPTVIAEIGDWALMAEAGAALTYRPGDPVELARRLREIAAAPEVRDRLARNGRRFAEAQLRQGSA
jgi:glycosyltransferase involved in cell wall biosynthesis